MEELKRRRIVRIALVYGATVFAVLQAADVLIPALRLPDWIITALAAMALLGLPVVIGLAWAFEGPPPGDGAPDADPDTGVAGAAGPGAGRTTFGGWLTGRTLATVLGIVAVGLLAGWYARTAPGSTPDPADAGTDGPIRFAHVPDSTHFIDFRCCGPLFAISRDGRRFAYAGGNAAGRPVYVREMGRLAARPVPGTEGGAAACSSRRTASGWASRPEAASCGSAWTAARPS